MTGTIKISELNAAASLTGTEEVPIVAAGATKRTTTLAIANLASVSSGTITIGNTPISGGTTTRVLYDNGGFVGEYAISGTGSVAMTNSPTLVTPALGVPTSLTLTNATGLPVGGIDATGTPSVSTFLRGDGSWAAAGAGTVTSVAQTFTGGLISVAGSPITSSGTLALTVAGTSGGIPYFSSSAAWASSAALAATALVIGGGAGAAPTTSANLTFSSPVLTIGVASTTQGQLALANTTANSVTVQSSNSTSAAWTLTLPVDAGTNGYALTTNGSGVASWTAISATPGGSSGQVQYNDAGAFGGVTGLTLTAGTLSSMAIAAGTLNGTVLDITQTWGGTGTYTGILYNVTDSGPSNAASLLMDLQVGGTSQFKVDKTGLATLLGGLVVSSFSVDSAGRVIGLEYQTSDAKLKIGNVANGAWSSSSDYTIAWTNGANYGGTKDLILARDAANTLALRNSTNAQTFNVYSSYTDASNYERVEVGNIPAISGNIGLSYGTSGTGTARNLYMWNNTASGIIFATNAGSRWTFNSSGHLLGWVDNTYDLGASGANRPRTGYFGTRVQAPVFRADNDYTVATLPTGVVGNIARVTDASAPAVGSTVTGGGAAAALVWYNGSNYTVIGI